MPEKAVLKNIGANITKLRAHQGLSLRELSELCGIEKANLIPIEKGRKNITIITAFKISRALGVEIKTLFTFDDSAEPAPDSKLNV